MKPRIGIITSKGGHVYQMHRLKPWWSKYDHFWVTFSGEDVASLLKKERVYYGYYPETRHMYNAIRHLGLAWHILRTERPTLLISCGAGIAPPFFIIGKLLGIKTVFIEVFDLLKHPSLTGRILSPFVDHILVQHPTQKKFYPRAHYKGAIL
ncbi:UDP-N-acetylglucosamine--LPS N-acetylglucosamine transferase [Patescibacteria group bacterium]|nr:UDP-N-acetylglucosamine--LPS N-acetylglucosamine transferase [Patescibacteria group bacterium]